MRTLQEYANVIWENIQGLSIAEPKKGEGVLFISMDIPEDVDISRLVAAKHNKNVVVGLRTEDIGELTSDNAYRVLSIVAHSLLNYVIESSKYVLLEDDKLIISLKNNMVHFIVTGVLLEDGIII